MGQRRVNWDRLTSSRGFGDLSSGPPLLNAPISGLHCFRDGSLPPLGSESESPPPLRAVRVLLTLIMAARSCVWYSFQSPVSNPSVNLLRICSFLSACLKWVLRNVQIQLLHYPRKTTVIPFCVLFSLVVLRPHRQWLCYVSPRVGPNPDERWYSCLFSRVCLYESPDRLPGPSPDVNSHRRRLGWEPPSISRLW